MKQTHNSDLKKALINGSYAFTAKQIDIFMMIVALVKKDDKPGTWFELHKNQIIESLNLSSKHFYSDLIETMEKFKTPMIDLLKAGADDDSDKKKKKPTDKIAILINAPIDENSPVLRFKFHPDIEPYLFDLAAKDESGDLINGPFTSIQLGTLLKLNSKYAKRLYMMLKGYNPGNQFAIEITDLKKQLGVYDNSGYSLYANFEKRILLPAQEELEATDRAFMFIRGDRSGKGGKINRVYIHLLSPADGINKPSTPVGEGESGEHSVYYKQKLTAQEFKNTQGEKRMQQAYKTYSASQIKELKYKTYDEYFVAAYAGYLKEYELELSEYKKKRQAVNTNTVREILCKIWPDRKNAGQNSIIKNIMASVPEAELWPTLQIILEKERAGKFNAHPVTAKQNSPAEKVNARGMYARKLIMDKHKLTTQFLPIEQKQAA